MVAQNCAAAVCSWCFKDVSWDVKADRPMCVMKKCLLHIVQRAEYVSRKIGRIQIKSLYYAVLNWLKRVVEDMSTIQYLTACMFLSLHILSRGLMNPWLDVTEGNLRARLGQQKSIHRAAILCVRLSIYSYCQPRVQTTATSHSGGHSLKAFLTRAHETHFLDHGWCALVAAKYREHYVLVEKCVNEQ